MTCCSIPYTTLPHTTRIECDLASQPTVVNMFATERRSHSRTHMTFCSRAYPPLGFTVTITCYMLKDRV